MRKWFIVIILMVAAIAVNVIFWNWSDRDAADYKEVVSTVGGRWMVFEDPNFVKLLAPTYLEKETAPGDSVYWFESEKNQPAMFYQKFNLNPKADPVAEVKKLLSGGDDCREFITIKNFWLLRDCEYLKSNFDIAFFSADGWLGFVGVNKKYFSEEEVDGIIKSIEKK